MRETPSSVSAIDAAANEGTLPPPPPSFCCGRHAATEHKAAAAAAAPAVAPATRLIKPMQHCPAHFLFILCLVRVDALDRPPPAGAACKKERTKAEPRVTRSPVGHTNPPAQPSLPSSPESRAAPPSSRQPRADAPTSPTASSSSRPTAGRSEPSTSDAQSTASCPAVPQQARHTDLLNLL